MQVVIFAGGAGTRLSEETYRIPKPMVEIGGIPIIVHIMRYYRSFGFKEFIICAGYKVDYIKNVYTFFREQKINFETLKNDEIIKILCKIKGVGSWTAEMFLIFILFRKNILSIKDIALINSIKKNYKIMNLDSQKLNELIRSWEPYNTAASLLLWKSIEEKTFYK